MANTFGGRNFNVDTDALLWTGKIRVIGVHVTGGTAAVGRCVLRDGLDATGRVVFDSGDVAINASESFPRFIECQVGLYADVTVPAGASVLIDIA